MYIVRDRKFRRKQDAVAHARKVVGYEGQAAIIFKTISRTALPYLICKAVRGQFVCTSPAPGKKTR